jgi:hypothetical protein
MLLPNGIEALWTVDEIMSQRDEKIDFRSYFPIQLKCGVMAGSAYNIVMSQFFGNKRGC